MTRLKALIKKKKGNEEFTLPFYTPIFILSSLFNSYNRRINLYFFLCIYTYYCSFGYGDYTQTDKTEIYIDILNFLKRAECKILLIIGCNAITEYLYKGYIIGKYEKRYDITGKKSIHLVIGKNI